MRIHPLLTQDEVTQREPGQGPPKRGASRHGTRFVRALLPALLAGAFVWSFSGESSAAERCNTKPAVCARLKAMRAARATPPPQAATAAVQARPATVASASARCNTKPAVCARLAQREPQLRPSPPTFVAQTTGSRCATKPAVCARLKMRESQSPVTLASTGASTTD